MSDTVTLSDLLGDEDYVETSRGRLEIRGLGVGEVLRLIAKYPILTQNGAGVSISTPALIETSPESVPEIIAIAAGLPGKDGQKAARRFSATDQVKILNAVIERSMPDGPGPFAEEIAKMLGLLKA